MNITSVTVMKTAEESTNNGVFILEYSITDHTLSRVQATIEETTRDSSGVRPTIGVIYMEHGNVSCSLPSDRNLSPYFCDFDNFRKSIEESILAEN